ncbi:MAG: LCP family protein [Clostridia bacterium]|nr:LCP family protein [Clostridia bacterium]
MANNVTNSEPIYILLLGQNNDLGQSLTDTIICFGYDPEKQEAFLVSIPRDTFVGKSLASATPNDKINSIYSDKNPERMLEKVNQLTGLNIEYYIKIDNNTLIKLVDIIGGAQFDVPIDMNYDDKTQNLHIHLKKGLQMIDGKKAEMLLRFRHNNNGTSYPAEYGDNDYGRMKTGRNFLLAVLEQTLKVKSVDEITKIVKLCLENVKTNLSTSYLLSYLVFATDFDTENLKLEQLPGESVYTNGVWVFKANDEETKELFENVKF